MLRLLDFGSTLVANFEPACIGATLGKGAACPAISLGATIIANFASLNCPPHFGQVILRRRTAASVGP